MTIAGLNGAQVDIGGTQIDVRPQVDARSLTYELDAWEASSHDKHRVHTASDSRQLPVPDLDRDLSRNAALAYTVAMARRYPGIGSWLAQQGADAAHDDAVRRWAEHPAVAAGLRRKARYQHEHHLGRMLDAAVGFIEAQDEAVHARWHAVEASAASSVQAAAWLAAGYVVAPQRRGLRAAPGEIRPAVGVGPVMNAARPAAHDAAAADRLAGTLIGLAAGDALGAGYEFATLPRRSEAAMIAVGEPGLASRGLVDERQRVDKRPHPVRQTLHVAAGLVLNLDERCAFRLGLDHPGGLAVEEED